MLKKGLSVLLCLCLLWGCIPGSLAAGETFTLMVYLCGTDLESQGGMGSNDLAEMFNSRVPADGKVTVLVQTGGTKEWQIEGIGNRVAERWTLNEEGMQMVDDSPGRVGMGDAATLTDFIQYGFANYPADRYGLILWDHGGGATGGVCYDEMTNDALDYSEIYTALKKATDGMKEKVFFFIGFDACLMATYETACHVEPFAEYMVASEELEPGTGWSYDGWLPALAADPGISMEELGPKMVDSFIRATLAEDSTDYATLSVSDLSKLDALQTAVEAMAVSLGNEIEGGGLNTISRLRQNVRSFGEVFDSASDMVDLNTFAEVYARYDEKNAQGIKDALKDMVVYNRCTDNLTGVSGLSILVPFSTRAESGYYMPAYEKLSLSPNYTSFVKSLLNGVSSGSGSGWFDFGTPTIEQQSIQSAQIDWFSQYADDSESYGESASSLWGDLYGDDMTESNADDFSLDSFLSALFSGEDSGVSFNDEQDGSGASLWGDTSSYTDTSFATDSGFGSGFWGGLLGEDAQESTGETQQVTVNTGSEDITLDNPFADTDSEYAYTVQLTGEQLEYLGKVEANLMMDISDPDFECYVELGYVQDVVTDWERGKIYGMFDGSWATLDGQMVCMYDQIANERYIRSLIPVTLNGEECYLLVVFDEEHPGGVVTGASEGYTEAGLPARGTIKLNKGDVVVPQYELLYWDENEEQQSEPFEGDPIEVGADGSIPFGYEAVESDADYVYGFCLTDIYGDYQFTDFVSLSF